jgi:hypothetical protein
MVCSKGVAVKSTMKASSIRAPAANVDGPAVEISAEWWLRQ